MGQVYSGIPESIVNRLLQNYSITTFVETGTYRGTTTVWASRNFNKVYTIEKSEDLWKAAKSKFSELNNVNFLLGDSREIIKSLVSELNPPILFWLDAHWSGGVTYGEEDECALIGELELIKNIEGDKFIFIDDARLFLSPPPHPYSPNQWPSICDILKLLDTYGQYIVIVNDVLISIPNYAKPRMVNYYQDLATENWEKYLSEIQKKNRIITLEKIKNRIRTILKKLGMQ
jgi:hypothetical protein